MSTTGENVKYSSHYGNQYGFSFEKKKKTLVNPTFDQHIALKFTKGL